MKKTIFFSALLIPIYSYSYELSGFLNLGLGIHDAKKVPVSKSDNEFFLEQDYVTPKYLGEVDGRPGFKEDTSAGVLFKNNFNQSIDYVFQIESLAKDKFGIQLEKAYVNYKLPSKFDLKIGRMRVPFYKFSDTLLENFDRGWVRTPDEMYSQFLSEFKNINGAQLDFNYIVFDQDIHFSAQLGVENTDVKVLGNKTDLKITNHYGVFGRMKNSAFDLHGSFFTSNMTLTLDKTTRQIKNFLTASQAVGVTASVDDYQSILDVNNKRARYLNAGGTFDWEGIHVVGEYSRRFVEGWLSSSSSFYADVGYWFGNFLPTVGIRKVKGKEDLIGYIPNVENFETEIDALIAAAPAGSNQLINTLILKQEIPIISNAQVRLKRFANYYQRSFTVNLRYDLLDNSTLKFSYQKIGLSEDSKGLFDEKPERNHANVYTLSFQTKY